MTKDANLKQEAEAFDAQILERVANGHIPDLRRSGRCDYFYNNLWRDQEFVNLYYGEVVEKVIACAEKFLNNSPNKHIRLLEVGCGPGQVGLELSRNNFDVVGLDLSGACIEIANKTAAEDPWLNKRGPLSYLQQDMLEHEGVYDIVLFTASLHHFSNCKAVADQVTKLLEPDGIIIVDEPARDLVSKKNTVVLLLIEGLLSAAEAYYRDIPLPETTEQAEKLMDDIYLKEKYETSDGINLQSVNDNEAGFKQMYPVLSDSFHQLEFRKEYAFFHQLIGGMRLKSHAKEHELARFLKVMDSILCKYEGVDPTHFYFVGRKID